MTDQPIVSKIDGKYYVNLSRCWMMPDRNHIYIGPFATRIIAKRNVDLVCDALYAAWVEGTESKPLKPRGRKP